MAPASLLMALLSPLQGHAQSFVSARAEFWGLHSGDMATVENRTGVALEGGVIGIHGLGAVSVGWIPEGDVAPGWVTIEGRGGITASLEALRFSAEAGVGGLNMLVGNRHRAIEGCDQQVGCFFEAPSFESGWGFTGFVAGSASVALGSGLELGLRYSRLRIFGGSNADESLSGLSLGLSYLLR